MTYTPSRDFAALAAEYAGRRDFTGYAALLREMTTEVSRHNTTEPRHAQQHPVPGLSLRVASGEPPAVPEPPSLAAALRTEQPELRTAAADDQAARVLAVLQAGERPITQTADLRAASVPLTTAEPPSLVVAIRAARGLSPAPSPQPRTLTAHGVEAPPDLTAAILAARTQEPVR